MENHDSSMKLNDSRGKLHHVLDEMGTVSGVGTKKGS